MQKILSRSKENQLIDNLTDYIIAKNKINVVSASGIEHIQLLNEAYKTENSLVLAYKLAKEIPLKTLDLLQISSALIIKLLKIPSMEFFLTNDNMILDNADIIRQRTKITSISSAQLVSMLRLK